jgi:hypothetical protein
MRIRLRFRPKTADEKEYKIEKKEEKKELRQEKQQARQDAREEKQQTRSDARADKKEVRQSDLSGKEKREAKKDIREQKREDIKEAKEPVKDIRAELKEVRKRDIIFPAAGGKDDEVIQQLQAKGLTEADVYDILDDALDVAQAIAHKGLSYIKTTVINDDRDEWVNLWNGDGTLTTWFGTVEKPGDAKDVYDRLDSITKRLDTGINIRVRPQSKNATEEGQNLGTFLNPKTFHVYPALFDQQKDHTYIASVIIHELMHTWFLDQKLSSGSTVYGETAAKQLAQQDPRSARRSAENYEFYCYNI